MWFRLDFTKAVKGLKQSNKCEIELWGFESTRRVPFQLKKLST